MEAGSGPAAVHLRLRGADGYRSRPLTGPTSGGTRLADGTILTVHDDLEARTRLQVAADGEAWAWSIHLRHGGDAPLELDLLHTLDIALTEREAIRRNEQYVAQYLDLTPVQLPQGGGREASLALAVRQNMPGPAAPWAAVGASTPSPNGGPTPSSCWTVAPGRAWILPATCPRSACSTSTPSLRCAPPRWCSPPARSGAAASGASRSPIIPRPPGPRTRSSSGSCRSGSRHPWRRLLRCLHRPQSPLRLRSPPPPSSPTLRSRRPCSPPHRRSWCRRLIVRSARSSCGGTLRLLEEDGRLLSAFSDRGHLVTAAKERLVLRPHGHIQQVHGTGAADLDTVASTVWMRGVFCSQLTLGHASTGALTAVRRSYLGLDRSGGVRLLLRTADGGWSLLSTPSLWLTDGASSQWLYLTETLTLRISSEVLLGQGAMVDIEVSGEPGQAAELLLVVGTESAELALQVTADGCPVEIGDDAALFSDGSAHGTGLLTARLDVSQAARVRLLHSAVVSDAPMRRGCSWHRGRRR